VADAPIPVTVIGGYLGAGKTTLLNRLLADTTGERLAVLVNDFGSVSIDASLIAAHGGDTIQLANGCVCCSLAGGFVEAMQTIAALDPPAQRLVVETSGVADPAAVAEWAHLPGFVLDAIVVLADAETVRRKATDALVGRHVLRQLSSADVVVLNKVDLVDDERRRATMAWIGEHAPGTPVVPAVEADIASEVIFGVAVGTREPRADGHGHHDGHHHTHTTVTVSGDAPVTREALDRALDGLGDDVVRVKGFVDVDRFDGRPTVTRTVVQRVGRRVSVGPHPGEPHAPAVLLVLIGVSAPAVAAAGSRLAAALGATCTTIEEEP